MAIVVASDVSLPMSTAPLSAFAGAAHAPLPLSSAPFSFIWPAYVPLPISNGIISQVMVSEAPSFTPDESLGVSSPLAEVISGLDPNIRYDTGYRDGWLYGFSSPHEDTTEQVDLGETDDDKKTIDFHLYTADGLPASGITGEGPVCSPAGSQIQTKRDSGAYTNSTGTFSHISDGKYRYTFATPEVDTGGGEGNIWLRVKVPGFRLAHLRVPVRMRLTIIDIRDAILSAARSGFMSSGTIGEGVAMATAILHGNFIMDQVIDSSNGETASRIRCFHTSAAAESATFGGSGEGEFATLIVTTTYSGKSKIATHRVVQQ